MEEDSEDGGLGTDGEIARGVADAEGAAVETGEGKTERIEGRDLSRMVVGSVRRMAAGFDDGVEGRVGGTTYSRPRMRLVDAVWLLAREAAVGASYPDGAGGAGGGDGDDPEADALLLPSIREDIDALRVTAFREEEGVRLLSAECDFCWRTNVDRGERKSFGDVGEADDWDDWAVAERAGGEGRGGDGVRRVLANCRVEAVGGG